MGIRSTWAGGLALLASLACGGGGETSAPVEAPTEDAAPIPAHGKVSFQKYRADDTTLRFKTDSTVEKYWSNMVGDPPQGTYVHEGDEITITWDPAYDNHSSREAHLRQLDPCSLALYAWKDRDGVVHDDDSSVYQRTEPKCPK